MELGAVVVKNHKGEEVVVEIPSAQNEIDVGYDMALSNLRERRRIESKEKKYIKANAGLTIEGRENYNRKIGTRLLLIWVASNYWLALAMASVFGS